jgi:hypothetical protein
VKIIKVVGKGQNFVSLSGSCLFLCEEIISCILVTKNKHPNGIMDKGQFSKEKYK